MYKSFRCINSSQGSKVGVGVSSVEHSGLNTRELMRWLLIISLMKYTEQHYGIQN